MCGCTFAHVLANFSCNFTEVLHDFLAVITYELSSSSLLVGGARDQIPNSEGSPRPRWLHEDGGIWTRLRRRPVGLRRAVVDVHAAGDSGAKPPTAASEFRRWPTTLTTYQSNAECGLLPVSVSCVCRKLVAIEDEIKKSPA
ncbi:hypothetical protein OESDEN_08820 [Oesophagostomum dentatum]|uniref:Uncharacterized protein n=1 Tax=Oesophagostomum dentatum TaxID=61180 RepID=A0A0B1T245_OESDE|nr:hypothetical protein OESDEN_08820 [Oesophagostomum dentatum]